MAENDAPKVAQSLVIIEENVDSLARIADDVREFAARARAPATLRAYGIAWRRFEKWAVSLGQTAQNARPAAVAGHIKWLFDRGMPRNTIEVAAAGIVHYLRPSDPTLWPSRPMPEPLRSTLEAVRRHGIQGRPKRAFTVDQVRKAVAALTGDGLRVVRDRAVLLLSVWLATRRSELTALGVADVTIDDEKLVAFVHKSKTDQKHEGKHPAAPRAEDPSICAVRAVERWIELSGVKDGYLFRALRPRGFGAARVEHVSERRMGDKVVADVVKRAAKAIGLSPRSFAAHSTRAGFCTTAAKHGATAIEIAQQTGHLDLKQVMKYVRQERPLEGNAVMKLEGKRT
jgi:integrase